VKNFLTDWALPIVVGLGLGVLIAFFIFGRG